MPVLDTGARGSLTTFAQRGIGDVLISWENEAFLATKELGKDKFEIVVPSVSILAEPPVAVVDKVALRRGTTDVARAYLEYLYSKEGQEIVAKHYYRPRDPEVAAKYASVFPKIDTLVTIADFGGWAQGADHALRRRRHLRQDLRALIRTGLAGGDSGTSRRPAPVASWRHHGRRPPTESPAAPGQPCRPGTAWPRCAPCPTSSSTRATRSGSSGPPAAG